MVNVEQKENIRKVIKENKQRNLKNPTKHVKENIRIDNHLSSEMGNNRAALDPATQGDVSCEVENEDDDDYDMGF